MKHLFIGGTADGAMIEVAPDMDVFYILRDRNLNSIRELYARKVIKTPTGQIDVFTHGVDCPITAMVQRYAENADFKRPIQHIEGGTYDHIGTAEPAGKARAQQCEPLQIYRGRDGKLWYRFYRDFVQRFKPV